MDIIKEEEEPVTESAFAPSNYEITFENMSFAYEKGQGILEDISLTILEGKLTAIVGDFGFGKSPIMNLISKYYEPTEGIVCIGVINLKDFLPEKVLSNISLVDQNVFLFDDTVRENIRHARP